MTAFDAIPEELRRGVRWALSVGKEPYQPNGKHASVSNPKTWLTFEEAAGAVERGCDGIGRMMHGDDGYVLIDLDHVIVNGELTPEAQADVAKLDSFTEISSGGDGLHVWVRATLPEAGRKRAGREMYMAKRFVVMTGRHLEGTPTTIEDRQTETLELFNRWFPRKATPKGSLPQTDVELTDGDLLYGVFGASNGGRMLAVWNGDTSGYDSTSEADLALCGALAYWGGSAEQIERLWLSSPLGEREKTQTRADYRQATIERALTRRDVDGVAGEDTGEADELAELQGRLSAMLGVLRNSRIKSERVCAIVVVNSVVWALSVGQDESGFVRLPLRRVAEDAGDGRSDTAGRHVKRLEEWGILERDVRREIYESVDRETGEIVTGWRSALWIRLLAPPSVTMLRLAALDPARSSTWGGKRVACPDHPNADTVTRWETTCSVCGKVLDEGETVRQPSDETTDPLKPQDGGLNDLHTVCSDLKPHHAVSLAQRRRHREASAVLHARDLDRPYRSIRDGTVLEVIDGLLWFGPAQVAS